MSELLVLDSEALLAFYLGEEDGTLLRDGLEKIQKARSAMHCHGSQATWR